MGLHRDLAIAAMKAATLKETFGAGDFMQQAGIPMPTDVFVPGALPAMKRDFVPAQYLLRMLDIVMAFGIGDYPTRYDCSSYYDPSSPWYNVFYGGYGLRSYKPGGVPWGYDRNGNPDWDEYLEIPRLDYCFLTAGQFGCPPEDMYFDVEYIKSERGPLWDTADLIVSMTSGLHDPAGCLAAPQTYVIYGVPAKQFLEAHRPFERVTLRGRACMRVVPQRTFPQPITQVFGALCPYTDEGGALLTTIMATLGKAYAPPGK
jgi:hypothetical protein